MLPVVITVYSDRASSSRSSPRRRRCCSSWRPSIPLEKKAGGKQSSPAEELAKKAGKYKGFKVTKKQVQEIAKKKIKRPERPRRGTRRPDHRGHRPQHGHHGRRLDPAIDAIGPMSRIAVS